MSRRIWATLDDFLPPSKSNPYVGRNVANNVFFKALLRYSTFDEFHFFLTNRSHIRLFEQEHGDFIQSVGAGHKIKVFLREQLPEVIEQVDYTVFHQSDHINAFNSLCYLRNKLGHFPVTAFIHSLSYQRYMHTYMAMCQGGVTASDAMLCSTENGAEVVRRCLQQAATGISKPMPDVQLQVLPLGMDGSSMDFGDRTASRTALGFADTDVVGLCFGRFSDYDKMDLLPLLQGFRDASKDHPNWKLVLAGYVQSEDYLKIVEIWIRILGLSSSVIIERAPSDDRKAKLFRASDMFISLSDNPQETFGLTLVEAMAAGLPLLVSDYDGYRNLVTEDVGVRVHTSWDRVDALTALGPILDEATYHRYLGQSLVVDMTDLRNKLTALYDNAQLRKTLGKAARDKFLANYDCPVVIARLEQFWDKLKAQYTHIEDPSPDPSAMDFFETFGHYPTNMATDDQPLEMSEFGHFLASKGSKYPLLAGMEGVISHEVIGWVNLHLHEHPTVGGLVHASPNPEWRIRYCVLWMLKHDLIQRQQ